MNEGKGNRNYYNIIGHILELCRGNIGVTLG